MNKKSNKFKDKFLDFKILLKENKKITVACFLLVFSIGLYFIVFASDADPYEDKFNVKFNVTSVSTGKGYGDDSEDNNIIRNFDDVTYNVDILLQSKIENDSDLDGKTIDRTVIADVLIPSSASVNKVTSSMNNQVRDPETVQIGNESYTYYAIATTVRYINQTMTTGEVQSKNTLTITLQGINTTEDYFTPKISLRESTDTGLNYSNGENIIPSDVSTLSVIGTSNYKLKVFAGNIIKDESNSNLSTVPVGVMIYLPVDKEEGLKGIKLPSSISYNVSVSDDDDSATLDYENADKKIRDYTSSSDFKIGSMPTSKTGNGEASINGDLSLSNITISNFNIDTNNTYKIADGVEGVVVSTNAFVYTLNRNNSTNDINISFNAAIGDISVPDDNVNLKSSTSNVIGDLSTRIRFIDQDEYENKGTVIQTQTNPTYNLGEEFYTRVSLGYVNGENSIGDVLTDGMDTYIKLDNNAIRLLNYDGSSIVNVIQNGVHKFDNERENYEISYGVGTWALDTFEKTTDTSCTNVDLSRNDEDISDIERLMNLYGGPCLTEKAVEWKTEEDLLGDNSLLNKIMIIKIHFKKVYPSSSIDIMLKTAVKDTAVKGINYQVVVNSTTKKDNNTYYLTKNQGEDGKNLMANPKNYLKEISGSRDQTPENEYGNSILVSVVKAKINKIATFMDDGGDLIENSDFTVGADEPIIWKINAIGKKSNLSNIRYSKAIIDVYIPEELIFYVSDKSQVPTNFEDENNELVTRGDKQYKHLVYEFTADDINNSDGSINELVIYTNIMPDVEDASSIKLIAEVNYEVEIVTVGNDSTENVESEYCVDPVENRTKTATVTVTNNRKISITGLASPQLFNLGEEYDYTMLTYNNKNTIAGTSLELINVLPYNDELDETYSSNFSGSYNIKIKSLPSGYTAYFTKEDSKSIMNNEMNAKNNNNWQLWNDYMNEISGITAIKIVCSSKIQYKSYFGEKDGIIISIKPTNNSLGDEYLNNFYVVDVDDNEFYTSNDSMASVYNRQISGFVFEDYNYDGFYNDDESVLSDLTVELYKLDNVPTDTFDETKVFDYISSSDKLVDTTTTGNKGNYRFRGLDEGYYYVRIIFDSKKYTVADYGKYVDSIQSANTVNSRFYVDSSDQTAVSKVIYLNDKNIREEYINLGLRIRMQFGIDIDKFITNVKVISNKGTDNYDYDRAKQVKLNLKNLKNTTIEVTYAFELKNSKFFPGYVGSIIDMVPDGMNFNPDLSENYNWHNSDGILSYVGLSDTLIMPNENYNFKLVLTLSGEEAGNYLNVVAAGDTRLMSVVNGVDYGSLDDITGVQEELAAEEEEVVE